MKHKFSLRTISLIMSVIICFVSLPMAAFAIESDYVTDSIEASSPSSSTTESAASELQKEVMEMTDLREETVKHFRLEDGTYTAVQYEMPIHYLDDNGEWQDIDNTLSDAGSEYASSNARVKFVKKITGNESVFTLHEHNRKITMSLDGAKKKTEGSITNTVTEHGEDATQLQKLTTLDKISASIIYKDILDGVDLEYVVVSSNIKENIIVKEKLDSYTFSFTVALNNLDAELLPDGSVNIFDASTNESVYIIPKGYMYDADGEFSDAVTYSLIDLGNGKYTFTVSADPTWINSPERTFPVTIDPPIYTMGDSNVEDTFIKQGSATSSSSYGSQTYLEAGGSSKLYWKTPTLPTLPNYAYIASAFFVLSTNVRTSECYLGAYQVITDWDDGFSWDIYSDEGQGDHSDTFSDFVYTDLNHFSYEWNITDIVKSWYSGTDNFGIAISGIDGYSSYEGIYHSSEATSASARPKLYINYKDLKGVENYWSYSSHSAGNAGTGSINLATGMLSFAIPLLSTTDSLMPLTVSLVYSGDMANKYYTNENAEVPYIEDVDREGMAGYGFKLNINETIVERSYISSNGTETTYYVWSDSDGTEHYFLPDANDVYRDEDGLGLILEENTSTYTISSQDHLVKTFTKYSSDTAYIKAGGVLSSITDKNGNSMVLTCGSDGRVWSVDLIPKGLSEINLLNFTYNDHGMIEQISRGSNDDSVKFYYSETCNGTISTESKGYLRRVERVFSDATYISNYSYNIYGYITSVRDEVSKYQIDYTYDNSYRIKNIAERAGSYTVSIGQTLNIGYYNGYTTVRSSGTDDVINTEDDIITKYSFDVFGRAISIYSSDVSGTIVYGATNGEYVSDNENAANRFKESTITNGVSSNYLLNGDFEKFSYDSEIAKTVTVGSTEYWSTTGTVGTVAAANEFAASMSVTSTATSSIYQYVFLPVGEYTLSMWLDTNGREDVTVTMKATSITNGSNVYTETYKYGNGNVVSLRFSSKTTGGEKFKISISVSGASTVPSGTTVKIDNVMLSNTIGANAYDLVSFGSFESTSINSSGSTLYTPANFWTLNNRAYVSSGDSLAPSDNVLRVSGFIDEDNYASQVVFRATKVRYNSDINFSEETTFKISGFARGTEQSNNDTSAFRLRVVVKYNNGYEKTETFDFSPSQTMWQFVSGTFTICPSYDYDVDLNGNSLETGVVESITVYCDYFKHPGIAFFDNISVVQVDNDTAMYAYNPKGQIIYYRSSNDHREWYSYDENDNLIKTVTSDGNVTQYTYNNNHNVLTETVIKHTGKYNPLLDEFENDVGYPLTKTTYTYNDYGLVEKVDTASYTYSSENPWQSEIVTEYEYNLDRYSCIFGSLVKTTDSLGNETQYFYDLYNGNLLAVINPDGATGTVYTYDGSGRVTMVRPASFNGTSYTPLNNEYAEYYYGSLGQLESICTYTTQYNISYDSFGNTDYISVGSNTIVDYTYNSNNGKLNKITYGNGLVESYVYDELDRIVEILYNNVKRYEYDYDANGNIYKVTDLANDTILIYDYDQKNRIVRMTEYDATQLDYNIEIGQSYDDESRLQDVTYNLKYGTSSSLEHLYDFEYNDTNGNIKKITLKVNDVSKGTMEYTYDSLQRATEKVISLSGVDVYAGYSFVELDENNDGYPESTSLLISQYVSKINGTTTNTYSYTYDENGNITRIVDGNGKNIYYHYDDIGQLVREDIEATNKTYVYTYDNAGNRTSKKTYAYTTSATLGTAQSTETYSYPDNPEYEEWGDQLQSINGYDITYDNIGNPLEYYLDYIDEFRLFDLEWEGRNLVYLSENSAGELDIYYAYNDEGIRISKTVADTEYKYTLNGTQIVSQEWDDKLMLFFYDESGFPIGYAYRTTSMAANTFYYYVFERNVQGDVVAIYNTSGTKLVSYTYDAWGNVSVSNINISGTNVGAQYNPFRYRGYYYDEEVGLYYLNSRYYDPNTGRFLNADGYLNANGDIVGFNMYAYCSNNPVMGYDPYGTWDWESFFDGVDLLSVGIAAVAISVTILSCGGAAPAMLAIAATTFAAGTITTINGVAELVEAGTGYNFVAETLFNGNEDAYEAFRDVTKTVAEVGTAICSVYYAAKGGNVCFVAGTLVATAIGHIGIENIKEGDWVWATDPETGETELKQVVQTFVSETYELVHLTIGDEVITATPTHPFYVPNKGWTRAIDLRAGDILVTVNGDYVILEQVQHEILESPVTVYNFEVEGFHTYYVGEQSFLVHNKCPQRAAMREAKRSVNIPMSQKPDLIEKVPMIGEDGRHYKAIFEKYGNKFIRNDWNGHMFRDGGTLSRHFNAGIIDDTGKLIQNGLHFWY